MFNCATQLWNYSVTRRKICTITTAEVCILSSISMQHDEWNHQLHGATRFWLIPWLISNRHIKINVLECSSDAFDYAKRSATFTHNHQKGALISRDVWIGAEPSDCNHALTHIWYTLYEQWLFGLMSAPEGSTHARSPLIKCQPWQDVRCWRWPSPCLTSAVSFFLLLSKFHFLLTRMTII